MTTPPAFEALLNRRIRRHWVHLLWRAGLPGGLTALLWLAALLAILAAALEPGRDWAVALALVSLAFSLPTAAVTLVIYYDWSNDYLLITRDQITHYEQHYIFSHSTQIVPLRQVQNVGIYVPNVLYHWLNAGRVFVDTAGQQGALRFSPVKDPRGIQSAIFELVGRPVPPQLTETPASWFERFLPIYPVRTSRGFLIWHRHPWVLARDVFWWLAADLGLLAVIVLGPLTETIWPSIDLFLTFGTAIGVILFLVWMGVSVGLWYIYENWKNDYWIITDTHIIDIVARPFPFSSEDRRQARLEDIQDVRTAVPSLFDRLIRKGHVFAETAGKAQNFELRDVMDPNSIQDEIFKRRAAARALAQQAADQARLVEREEFQQQVMKLVEERLNEFTRARSGGDGKAGS